MKISRKDWKFLHERIVRLEMDCVHHDFLKEQLVSLHKKINELGKRVPERELVSCEVCGCLLNKTTAIQGESEIRGDRAVVAYIGMEPIINNTEHIYHPYYCKVHAPKPKTKEKK